MKKPIPYGKQHLDEDDIQAVVEVLKSDFLTQGPAIPAFESAFAQYVGSSYAVAVSNGTAALHLCALALNIQPGQKVITTPITFVASANCVRYAGGEVLFADIDPASYLLDLNQIEDLVKNDKQIKGIIPVDFAGYPVQMEDFKLLAEKYGLWLLEDACHAPGGAFTDNIGKKQTCGNGNFADLAIFSFHPVKHIAAGEGGMITTNSVSHSQYLQRLRTHGITKDPDLIKSGEGSWYYEMQDLGFNYRLTDIQAALGLSQLKKAAKNLTTRRKIAAIYDQELRDLPLILPYTQAGFDHAYHLYVIQTEKRDELYQFLKEKDIFTQIHYIPVHLQPYYQQFGWQKGDFPHAGQYYDRCLSLPMYPALSDVEQQYVIDCLKDFFNGR
ncbi:MAG: UDP-4-amino-4,6-dideoxy-N-acetyl-beta-L-altrosamine transaminase [Candidatus Cyclobacteriaceae bacterium M3_2C_046]